MEALKMDTRPEIFSLDLFIKERGEVHQEDVIRIRKALYQHFDIIKFIHIELLAQSSQFPFIDFANFNHFWERI